MKDNTDIWFADLLRAFHALAPADETTKTEIARMAGFKWQPRVAVKKPDKQPLKPALPDPDREHFVDNRPPAPPPLPLAAEELDGMEEDLPLIRITESQGPSTEWQSVRPLDAYTPGQGRMPPPYISVFRPEWSRALATTLAAVSLPIGPVDEKRLVTAAASGRPTTVIPRQLCWSLSLGVQLLLDVGQSMEPFTTDETQLLELFHECIGPNHVQDAQFLDCPTRGILIEGRHCDYSPPDFGVPVVAVSDIGLGGPALHVNRSRPREWLAFSRMLASRGSTLVVLIPYPTERWPKELRRGPVLVEWDRPTTTGAIRRLMARQGG